MEKWKPIENYEELYDVSSRGRVRSYRKMIRGRPVVCDKPQCFMKPENDGNGYLMVSLSKNGNKQSFRVHRLVLESFIGKCPKGKEGCHLDNNKSNCALGNLKWDTHKNNQLNYGPCRIVGKGEQNPMAKLSENTVRAIKMAAKLHIYTHQEIADYFEVNRRNVSKIIQGIRWSHIVV